MNVAFAKSDKSYIPSSPRSSHLPLIERKKKSPPKLVTLQERISLETPFFKKQRGFGIFPCLLPSLYP